MTILLTIAIVFAVLLIGISARAIGQAINGDWPDPGE